MTLTPREYRSYLNGHLDLLWYAGKQGDILAKDISFQDFLDSDLSTKFICRNFLLGNKNLMSDFRQAKANELTDDHTAVMAGIEKSITDDFIILKCLSNHAIFLCLKDSKVYAVKALDDRFDEFFDHFPVVVNTTILPFNGQIIYDGFLKAHKVLLGKQMELSMTELYNQAKKNNQVLTTL